MKVLLVASEVAPIIKLGGLGDVIGSLPKALEKLGVNIDVIVPFFPIAKTENIKLYKSVELDVPFANDIHVVEVHKTKLPDSDVDVLLLKNAEFFSTGGQHAFQNKRSETEMFSFFSRAVVEYVKAEFNTYDLIHCNDWHTGLITHLLHDEIGKTRPATLVTVHNLGYQGAGDPELVREVGIDPSEHRLISWDIEDGDINLLLQGITSADYISTVSPSYAKEILLKDMGAGLSGILQSRKDRLAGILNGIDYSQFPRDYDETSWREKKADYKKKLQEELGLHVSTETPLFSFISRLDPNQKGLDILIESIPEIIAKRGQFVLLGTGDSEWGKKFEGLAEKNEYKEWVSANIVFDVELAEKIYKASDFFIMPSRYEPCGLTQMISMHYGTVPVVHAVGGLRDTVKEGENGFTFDIYTTKELVKAINRAVKIYGSPKFEEMVKVCMQKDFSWERSAKKYKQLYEEVIEIRWEAMEVQKVIDDEEEEHGEVYL